MVLTQRAVLAVPASLAGARSVVTEAVGDATVVALDAIALRAGPARLAGTALLLAPAMNAFDAAHLCRDGKTEREND